VQYCSTSIIRADQGGEESSSDVRGLLALPIVSFGREVKIFAVATRYVDPLLAFHGVCDTPGVLRQIREGNCRHGHS
jgi:hypothetical protein